MCVFIYIYIYIFIYIYIYMYMYVCIRICICIHTHTQSHAYLAHYRMYHTTRLHRQLLRNHQRWRFVPSTVWKFLKSQNFSCFMVYLGASWLSRNLQQRHLIPPTDWEFFKASFSHFESCLFSIELTFEKSSAEAPHPLDWCKWLCQNPSPDFPAHFAVWVRDIVRDTTSPETRAIFQI